MQIFDLTPYQWQQIGISAGILAAAFLFARPLINFLLNQVAARLARLTRTKLDDMLLKALHMPLYWLVVLAAADAAVTRLTFLGSAIRQHEDAVFYVGYATLVLVAGWRLVNMLADWYQQRPNRQQPSLVDDQLLPFVRRLALLLLVVLIAISVLGYFKIEVGGLVATLGIGSLAVALAAQAALSDTISGFLIMVDQPYRIGDRIELLEIDTWGDVVDIGLRSTRILTPDHRMVIIPNSVIAKSLVVNRTSPKPEYRVKTGVGVAYGSDLEAVRQTLVEAVRGLEGVSADHPVEALLVEFGDSSLNFEIRWWISTYQDLYVIFDRANTAMYNALAAAQIEIPFPQRDVHHKLDPLDAEGFVRAFGSLPG